MTLTNGAGNSTATVLNLTKNTAAPPLVVSSVPTAVNSANVSSFAVSGTDEKFDTVTYTVTDGVHSVGGSYYVNGNQSWSINPNLTSLSDGQVTLTVTATNGYGSQDVLTYTLIKKTIAPVAPQSVVLSSGSDSGASSSDYVTNINNPSFTVTPGAGASSTAVYVNGTLYSGQHLADGTYTVTAVDFDSVGNPSAPTSAPSKLVVDTHAPSGSFTVAGAKTINSQLATNSKTPTLTPAYSDTGGLSTIAYSINGGAYSTPAAYTTSLPIALSSGDGVYTLAVRVTDLAGNVTTSTLTVRLDTAAPTITPTLSTAQGTMGAGTYDASAGITASISATDVDGISSTTSKVDGATFSGSVINVYTLTAGSHTLSVTSVDGLGNASTVSVTFTINPSLTGVQDLVKYAYSAGLIAYAVETSLLGYLTNTSNTLAQDLTNFENAVSADVSSSKVTSAEASLFQSWAQALAAGK